LAETLKPVLDKGNQERFDTYHHIRIDTSVDMDSITRGQDDYHLHRQVIGGLAKLVYDHPEGMYREKFLVLLKQSLLNVDFPELNEKIDDRHKRVISDKDYLEQILRSATHFQVIFGKDGDLFEYLSGLVSSKRFEFTYESPQTESKNLRGSMSGPMLVGDLIYAIAKGQTDRRFWSQWRDMTHQSYDTSNNSFYPLPFGIWLKVFPKREIDLEDAAHIGLDGLLSMPPLTGDVNGVPADVVPSAFLDFASTLSRLNLHSEYDDGSNSGLRLSNEGIFRREVTRYAERFPGDVILPILKEIFNSDRIVWPGFAQNTLKTIESLCASKTAGSFIEIF